MKMKRKLQTSWSHTWRKGSLWTFCHTEAWRRVSRVRGMPLTLSQNKGMGKVKLPSPACFQAFGVPKKWGGEGKGAERGGEPTEKQPPQIKPGQSGRITPSWVYPWLNDLGKVTYLSVFSPPFLIF